MQRDKLALFEEKQIRMKWYNEDWYYSVVDVIFALTDSKDPRDYWYKLKTRVNEEAQIELSTICRRLKLSAKDETKGRSFCLRILGQLR